MSTSWPETRLLEAMAAGWTLKAHRYLDGRKEYRLHALEGGSDVFHADAVEALVERGWIDSNKKFPAATFWLTEKGRQALQAITEHHP